MHLSVEELGMLKKECKNLNPLNICIGIKECEGDYEIKADDKRIVEIITSPDRVSRVILQVNGLVIEKYGYVKNNEHVLAENIGGELFFSDNKDNVDIATATCCKFIGMSDLRKADINIVMDSGEEVLLLMAILDIYREKTMMGLCGSIVELSAIFEEIRSHLDKPLDTSMVSLFKNNYKYKSPVIADTKALLDKFVEKGILAFDNKYKLTENYEFFAITFLVPDVIMTVENLQVENGEVMNNGMLFISAGVQSNLLFVFGSDGIEISTVSGAKMLEIIKNSLSCPKL